MADGVEAELRTRFALREERFAHGGWEASLLLPRAADELIDEAAFDADERLPYWAELWPSARALARHLLDREAGGPALELGCGVALPSLALRSRGVEVLATDWYADALLFARANAERNGLTPLATALLDWRHPPEGLRYERVIAADVLYEPRNAESLALLLPRVLVPGGHALVADPGRVYAGEFFERMRAQRWAAELDEERSERSAQEAWSRIRIWRLVAPGPAQRASPNR